MNETERSEIWVRQAQLDADRGVIECRVCQAKGSLADSITLWRNAVLVFAACHECLATHDILMRPTERGLTIGMRLREPLIVGARA